MSEIEKQIYEEIFKNKSEHYLTKQSNTGGYELEMIRERQMKKKLKKHARAIATFYCKSNNRLQKTN
jgi:hypothetical protein